MSIMIVGFMAVGKTSVGKQLARKLNRPFIDLDDWIENQEKMTINELFRQNGEEYFRQCEYEALKRWQDEPVVIATGGGVITLPDSRKLLKHHPNVIGLDLEERFLIKRLKDKEVQATRPLLRNKSLHEALSLYHHRLDYYYEVTDYWITYSDEQTEELVERIWLFLKDKTSV